MVAYMTQVVLLSTCKEAVSSNDGQLEYNFHCCLLVWLTAIVGDKGDVEDSFSTSQLFSFSISFVLCIRRGWRMCKRYARGVVHTMLYAAMSIL